MVTSVGAVIDSLAVNVVESSARTGAPPGVGLGHDQAGDAGSVAEPRGPLACCTSCEHRVALTDGDRRIPDAVANELAPERERSHGDLRELDGRTGHAAAWLNKHSRPRDSPRSAITAISMAASTPSQSAAPA
jgi:hypothetical protein